MSWTPFWFDGAFWVGAVSSPRVWVEILALYSDKGSVRYLMNARNNPSSRLAMPSFGFDHFHQGPVRLGEWALKHGMDLSSPHR